MAHSNSSTLPEIDLAATRPHERDNVGGQEWAQRTLARFEEIWNGHLWTPDGWTGWQVRLGADHADLRAVTAAAIRLTGRWARISFTMADRVPVASLNGAIEEFLSDLKGMSDPGDPLSSLAMQPIPRIPGWLTARLKEDVADQATRRFNEARSVLQYDRRPNCKGAACRGAPPP